MTRTIKTDPEGIFIDVDVAMHLKEIGINQSAFLYYFKKDEQIIPVMGSMMELVPETLGLNPEDGIAAFSSDQLIRMLGSVMTSWAFTKDNVVYYNVHYKDPFDGMLTTPGRTIPNALAAMLSLLITKKKKPLDEANRWLELV